MVGVGAIVTMLGFAIGAAPPRKYSAPKTPIITDAAIDAASQAKRGARTGTAAIPGGTLA